MKRRFADCPDLRLSCPIVLVWAVPCTCNTFVHNFKFVQTFPWTSEVSIVALDSKTHKFCAVSFAIDV